MNFGEAIEKLKEGKLVRRYMWPTDQKFIFKQVPAEIKGEIVPKMQSLPNDAKEFFEATFSSEEEQIDALYYTNQIALVGLSNTISSYSASADDIFADDWVLI